MKKLMSILLLGFCLVGCTTTNPPDAPKAEGKWQDLNTNLKDIQAR